MDGWIAGWMDGQEGRQVARQIDNAITIYPPVIKSKMSLIVQNMLTSNGCCHHLLVNIHRGKCVRDVHLSQNCSSHFSLLFTGESQFLA